MSSDSDGSLDWSDTSSEDDGSASSTPIYSRAYQIEIFERSLRENVIAVMATGSGKTQIAKLRIEAELQKSVDKRVWFTAPSVVLAYQQYYFLSRQLPAFNFRLITGMDNADYWDREVWNKALSNINVVVSTPQILLDALDSSFVKLKEISLLVFDEAHHSLDGDRINVMMTNHYHTMEPDNAEAPRPHILGLSASPVTKKSTTELEKLETNLNAKCISPTQQLDDYANFVNMPVLNITLFEPSYSQVPRPLHILNNVAENLRVSDDPYMRNMCQKQDLESRSKVEKIMKKNRTPTMEEIRSFARAANQIHADLGPWASLAYIDVCTRKAQQSQTDNAELSRVASNEAIQFINSSLETVRTSMIETGPITCDNTNCSEKAKLLLQYLLDCYNPSLRALIFVKTKATAWALARLINSHPLMKDYQGFSFMGCSNARYHTFYDLAQLREQNEQLEGYRRGELNLCVATSVMEEGIDVPAMNLVICFDEPANIRSYIQSRGRARHQTSTFVLFRAIDDTSRKLTKWSVLEEEMKRECADADRALRERMASELEEETGPETFRVPGPEGGLLTYDNAISRLQRFCAKWSRGNDDFTNPVYRMVLDGSQRFAIVHLPPSLNAITKPISSLMAWKTERMAKRDAAFQAYKLLYRLGLLTDSLLPNIPADQAHKAGLPNDDIEKRDSLYAVEQQYDPWSEVAKMFQESTTVYAHRVRVKGPDETYPSMVLLLPTDLESTAFVLRDAASQELLVTICAGETMPMYPIELARHVSFHLLHSILGRRLKGVTADQLPLLLVPDIPVNSLQDWYHRSSGSFPVSELDAPIEHGQRKYLLLNSNENVPSIYIPLQSKAAREEEDCETPLTIVVSRLSRRLDYLSPPASSSQVGPPIQRVLLADDCKILKLPADFAPFMLLVPSITHMLEVAQRTLKARRGPLASLAISEMDLLLQALTTPATSERNYQRLEFLGDSLLKYYTSIQVFIDHPQSPESQLTVFTGRIVSNARLQRSTRELGLDRYITRHKFAGAEWRAGMRQPKSTESSAKGKTLSSKVLADVIEALIGAAYIDGLAEGVSEEKCLSALKLFIPEVSWRAPRTGFEQLPLRNSFVKYDVKVFEPVESMIGYKFAQPRLLVEALTHSAYDASVTSYDRLEFLGDAVLDQIVKTRLYNSPHKFDPQQMTIRRHALVSHATLAFFALQTKHVETTISLETNPRTRKTSQLESQKTVYLPDHVRRVGSRETAQQRQDTLATLLTSQDDINLSLYNGNKFPWMKLVKLNAPKSYSDIVESLLGAIFVDSGGQLEDCERMLDRMGYMTLVDRFAHDPEVDAIHPLQMFHELAPKGVLMSRRTRTGTWRCQAMDAGSRIAHCKRATCKEEAECRAAKRAVRILSKNADTKRKEGESHTQSDNDGGVEIAEAA